MTSQDYLIRNYRPTDFDDYLRLSNQAAALTADGGYLSPEAADVALRRPNYTPEKDLFVAEISGRLAAYLNITAEPKIGRAVLDCLVDDEHRRRTVAGRLYCRAAPRARELGAKVAHVNVRTDNTVARQVLEHCGFQLVRRFCELRVQLTELPRAEAAYPIRGIKAGEEDKLASIQNRAFTGSWGFSPNTVEEIRYATGGSDHSQEGILFVVDDDRPVGYVWTIVERNAVQGADVGRISMIGVDPDYRGHGIGRQIVLAGLAHLWQTGLRVVRLTVDSQNSQARVIYDALGFTLSDTSLWYEKPLDQATRTG